jgi:hypothetical protein
MRPGSSLAGVRLIIPDHAMGLPVLRALSFMYVLPPLPRCSDWASSSLISPSRISLPRERRRVGLHIVLFEACSAFTRVAARTLAQSPIRDQLLRRLQPFRHLHDCSGCFRLERSPGGARTHWKAPPCHGAHGKRTSRLRSRIRQPPPGPLSWRSVCPAFPKALGSSTRLKRIEDFARSTSRTPLCTLATRA